MAVPQGVVDFLNFIAAYTAGIYVFLWILLSLRLKRWWNPLREWPWPGGE